MAVYGPPIIRNREYRNLLADFHRAEHRNRIRPDDKNAGWDFEVHVAEKQGTIQVLAGPQMAVVRVKYQDEGDTRDLYQYVDYSHPRRSEQPGIFFMSTGPKYCSTPGVGYSLTTWLPGVRL